MSHNKMRLRIVPTIVALVTTGLILVAYGATKTLTAATVITCVGLLGIAIVMLRAYATRGCNPATIDKGRNHLAAGPSTKNAAPPDEERRAA
jgi:hypothetical protein